MLKLIKKIYYRFFKCRCNQCPYLTRQFCEDQGNHYVCGKDGIRINDDAINSIVAGCPKFWSYPKAMVTMAALSFALIIVAMWIGYYHLVTSQERYSYLMGLNARELPEIKLFCIGATMLFPAVTSLMYWDFRDQ